ncbi:hypothetical protein ACWOE8_21565, partial [Enterococcus avium]
SGFLFFLAIVYSPLDLIVEKEKPRSNHLPRINGYLHGLYYTLGKNENQKRSFANSEISFLIFNLPKTKNLEQKRISPFPFKEFL